VGLLCGLYISCAGHAKTEKKKGRGLLHAVLVQAGASCSCVAPAIAATLYLINASEVAGAQQLGCRLQQGV
jgi:hypothetical protein